MCKAFASSSAGIAAAPREWALLLPWWRSSLALRWRARVPRPRRPCPRRRKPARVRHRQRRAPRRCGHTAASDLRPAAPQLAPGHATDAVHARPQ
eukprot:scaffold654_cov273-Prasinococcus_capsulatus_cf.AAC.3